MTSLTATLVLFARSCIRSVEVLEVFILCSDNRGRWWDADSVAPYLGLTESRARRALDQLARANLLDIRISDAVRYRFAPGSEELNLQANALAEAYRSNPTEVVKLIARSSVGDSVQDFADAFRIKRDDSR